MSKRDSVSLDKRGAGRPRNVKIDEAILQAATEVFVEVGFEALTVEEVAQRAGVSRATVYLRWKNKLDLVRALLGRFLVSTPPPPPTGDAREDLRNRLGHRIAAVNGVMGRLAAMTIAESIRSAEFRAAMHRDFLAVGEEKWNILLRRGVRQRRLFWRLRRRWPSWFIACWSLAVR
jgi:AcrR family transcriptional regulator